MWNYPLIIKVSPEKVFFESKGYFWTFFEKKNLRSFIDHKLWASNGVIFITDKPVDKKYLVINPSYDLE